MKTTGWLATRERAEKCQQDAEAFVAQAERSLAGGRRT